MTLDHDTQMTAIGLPTRNPFDWQVCRESPPETGKQRNARLNRERYQAGKSAIQQRKAASFLNFTHRMDA
jgi:hypothetical protein